MNNMQIVASDHALKRWRERIAIYGDETIEDIRKRIGPALQIASEKGLQFVDYQGMRILLENRGKIIVLVTIVDKSQQKIIKKDKDYINEQAKILSKQFENEGLDINLAKQEYQQLCQLKKKTSVEQKIKKIALSLYLSELNKKNGIKKPSRSIDWSAEREKFWKSHQYWTEKSKPKSLLKKILNWLRFW